MSEPITFRKSTDLILDRVVPVEAEELYRGWTDPEWIAEWFVPEPYRVASCVAVPEPGGEFTVAIESPDGDVSKDPGCYLYLVPNRLVVFTDALGPGFRPTGSSFFTGAISFDPAESGTRYRARALHANIKTRDSHAKMGFTEGWEICLEQLVGVILSRRA